MYNHILKNQAYVKVCLRLFLPLPLPKNNNKPSTMLYSMNSYRPPSRREYICNQIFSFLDLLELFPACVLWKAWSIIIYSQNALFNYLWKIWFVLTIYIILGNKKVTIRKVSQFPFHRGMFEKCFNLSRNVPYRDYCWLSPISQILQYGEDML